MPEPNATYLPCLKTADTIAAGEHRERGTSIAASVDCDCRRPRSLLLPPAEDGAIFVVIIERMGAETSGWMRCR